jgi:hypothetical protein
MRSKGDPPPGGAWALSPTSPTASTAPSSWFARTPPQRSSGLHRSRHIWLHKGVGPSSVSEEAVALCRDHGIEVVDLLGDVPPLVPASAGVYILLAESTHFTYPAGGTSVFYIGMASNLRTRLGDHRRFTNGLRNGRIEPGERYYPRYEWGANHGAMVAWSVRPRSNSANNQKAVESELLREFALAFRAPPLANSQSAW